MPEQRAGFAPTGEHRRAIFDQSHRSGRRRARVEHELPHIEQLNGAGEMYGPGFVRTCSLVYTGEGEVSWYLTQRGLKGMHDALTRVDDAVRCVASAWRAHFPDAPLWTPTLSPH